MAIDTKVIVSILVLFYHVFAAIVVQYLFPD